jgi:hypothetical protein
MRRLRRANRVWMCLAKKKKLLYCRVSFVYVYKLELCNAVLCYE